MQGLRLTEDIFHENRTRYCSIWCYWFLQGIRTLLFLNKYRRRIKRVRIRIFCTFVFSTSWHVNLNFEYVEMWFLLNYLIFYCLK